MSGDEFQVVRGGAAPEDVAAVLAVFAMLAESGRSGVRSGARSASGSLFGRAEPDSALGDQAGYAAWRRTRLAALARDSSQPSR